MKRNHTFTATDYVRFYPMDWSGEDKAWVADATVTNPIWATATSSYASE